MIELNGFTSGIAIRVLYSNTKNVRFIGNKDCPIRLYTNMRIAKMVARTIVDVEKVEYFFIIDGKQYPVSSAYHKNFGVYKFVDKETKEIITVKETRTYKAINFSYIVFDNGDKEKVDKNVGYTRSRYLFDSISSAIESVFSHTQNDEYGIEYTSVYRGEYVVHLRNCTGDIHISTNKDLMDINQCRKEEGTHCFPFSKTMDKFVTFYCYVAKDRSESNIYESDVKAAKILDLIVKELGKIVPDGNVKFKSLNYRGFILYNE